MARPATAAVRLLTGEREPVRLATTANIDVNAGGLLAIDGVVTEIGDRVLVKNQADATQNGIYTASAGAWYRAADARTGRALQKGTTVHVQQGTVSADFVYAFQTLNPVIGASAIVLAFYLSEDTLGDATAAASAAAASAAAALTSKNAAGTSATNAGTSASAAAGSATAASGSASTASTAATSAGNSATAAAGSASAAATSSTNAGNSAAAASGSATAASGSATAAGTSATNAATSATNAAVSATASANAAQALPFTFSMATTDADPGNGAFRLNNAAIASATAAYVDNQDSDGVLQTGLLDSFDDSTNAIKGQLTIRSRTTAATKHVYNVTGSVVDGSGYRKLVLAYVGGSGGLVNAEACWLSFNRAGDKGADGLGTGDFSGPASSVADNIVTFAGTTGKLGKDSGIAIGNLAPKASPTFTGVPAAPTAAGGTNTTQLATTAFVAAAVAPLAPLANPALTGAPTAPTAAPGTNTTQIATTAFVAGAISPLATSAALASGLAAKLDIASAKLQGFYESPQQTITVAGPLTLAHGLGAKPKLYVAYIVCVLADQGYSPGAEMAMPMSNSNAITPNSMTADASNIVMRFGSNAQSFWGVHPTTGNSAGFTNANWKFMVRAWL